jgi:hypothetical protein
VKKLAAAFIVGAAALVAIPVGASAAGTWAQVPSQNSNSTFDNTLQGVACASSFSCFAVGYQGTSSGHNASIQTLIEQRTGAGWVIVPSQNGNGDNALIGATCVSSSDCWAVGYGGPPNVATSQAMTEHWNEAHGLSSSPLPNRERAPPSASCTA